jgi:hypothetical protein
MGQHHVTTGGGHRTQKRAGFNPVGHHVVGSAMQTLHALDMDTAGTVARYTRIKLRFCYLPAPLNTPQLS